MTQHSSPLERALVSAKVLFVGFLALICLIPALMVYGVVADRTSYQSQVQQEITKGWGGRQLLAGPYVKVPYVIESAQYTSYTAAYVTPSTLDATVTVTPEKRTRGFFSAVVYSAKVELTAVMPAVLPAVRGLTNSKLDTEHVVVQLQLNDLTGLQNGMTLSVNDVPATVLPGSNDGILQGYNGVYALVPANVLDRPFTVKASFSLQGSEALEFMPYADKVNVQVSGTWPAPKFGGRFLAKDVDLNEQTGAFAANWELSSLATGWTPARESQTSSYESDLAFGVTFLEADLGIYAQTERAIKYAVLFIFLTFGSLYLFEILARVRVHVVQYILVGAALGLFYLLLLSFAEVIGFLPAYLVSAGAIVGLISFYARYVLQAASRAWLHTTLLVVLYAYLYILLQIQDYALLIGSVFLFLVLAAVMFVTRKVDWYAAGRG